MLSAYLTLMFEKFFIVNMIHSDSVQQGHVGRGEAGEQLPPQILADQKAPPAAAAAARRITTCPPGFSTLGASLHCSKH